MGMPGATREELEAMSRDELKALADEKGLKYSLSAHNSTIINLILESEGEPDMSQEEAAAADAAEESQPVEPDVQITEEPAAVVVDPYKQVFSPWELPANTAAAAAIANQVTVDPDAPISDERVTQAKTAIQAHQDGIQEAISTVSDDPRLSGSTFGVLEEKASEEEAKV